jgi:hypothetical protein
MLATFVVGGWHMTGFRRSYGIKYLDRAVAQDGRVGTFETWGAREGNPVRLNAILEAL